MIILVAYLLSRCYIGLYLCTIIKRTLCIGPYDLRPADLPQMFDAYNDDKVLITIQTPQNCKCYISFSMHRKGGDNNGTFVTVPEISTNKL